ncbi:hypothetical protein ABL78_0888 [Leptomonas seymouri]|uniref:Leucine-rich repeat protein (LRRP) n=1 Tax=Leptomonas seymouri TaxID=5684 RepID=A0A0N1IMK0_LEPSE|nr:hypothetical protein ABL78_0888 [Leptomonas seymouri]|eukprot:KPI90028.1 hypothetical protein ABL78_0888 [Leptomonas seymouri]
MRTRVQQRYYDVLRREDRRKQPEGSMKGVGGDSGTLSISHIASHKHAGSQRTEASRAAYSSSSPSPLWDPIEQLNLDATTVVAMRELACDHRNLTALHPHFVRFEQLDSLVLSHNALRTLHNLLPPSHLSDSSSASPFTSSTATATAATASLYSGCRRLTRLHANHNELRDVAHETDIPRLLLLEHLSLAHNELTDLDCIMQPLRRLRHLRYLDLRGNPIVDEPSYRQRCIVALPQVEVLDGLTVTQDERRDAISSTATADFLKNRLYGALTATSRDEDSLPSPDAKWGEKSSTRRFAKSAAAQDLDAKYAAHRQQQQYAKAAAIEARVAAERQKEETWRAFHAIWSLSQSGMPLSEEGWRATMAAVVAGAQAQPALNNGGAGAGGDGAASRPGRKPPSQQQQQSTSSSLPGGLAARPRTPISTRPPQQPPGSTPQSTGTTCAVVKRVEVPRDRLLPPITSQHQPSDPKNGAQHDSPYFRVVRGTGEDMAENFSKALSNVPQEPSPVRLASIQQALQASTKIVRAMNSTERSDAADATCRPSQAPSSGSGAVDAPKPGGGSPPSSSSTTPSPHAGAGHTATLSVDVDSLRAIQSSKHAFIPPPWEHGEAASQKELREGVGIGAPPSSIGFVRQRTIIQEALVEVLVLLHQLFSAEELQLLETEYGKAELLRLLPLPEWSVAWDSAAEDTTSPVDTLLAAKQEMLQQLRPGAGAAAAGSSGVSGGSSSRRLAAEDRKKAAGAAGRSSGAQGNAFVATGFAATAPMGGALTAGEMAAVAMAAARASLSTEPEHLWNLFLRPFVAGVAPRASHLSQGRSNELSGGAAGNSSGNNAGGANAAAAMHSSTASGVFADEVTLQDPEVVQQLVRPVGLNDSRVLGSFLMLLKPPPPISKEELCDSVRHFHSVVPHVAAATVNASSSAASETGRGGGAMLKSKREALVPPVVEAEGNEGRRRAGKGNPNGHEQTGLKQHPSLSQAPQLSLVSILTALAFHPAFVRARLQHWEQELVRMTMAAAAAAPTTTTTTAQVAKVESQVGSGAASGAKAGSAPATGAAAINAAGVTAPPVTPLSRLFHRVQELKSYAARVEKAAAAALRPNVKGSSGEPSHVPLVTPAQVLMAFQR